MSCVVFLLPSREHELGFRLVPSTPEGFLRVLDLVISVWLDLKTRDVHRSDQHTIVVPNQHALSLSLSLSLCLSPFLVIVLVHIHPGGVCVYEPRSLLCGPRNLCFKHLFHASTIV